MQSICVNPSLPSPLWGPGVRGVKNRRLQDTRVAAISGNKQTTTYDHDRNRTGRAGGADRGPIGGGARVGGTTGRATTIDAGNPPVSRFMIIIMVHPRKLTVGVNRHFPHPFPGFGGEAVLQTNGLFDEVSVSGHLEAYKILPNSAKFYQFLPKTCSEGAQTGT